ncbi:hypothetical protein R3I94_019673 [Phoxinus phoxinus]
MAVVHPEAMFEVCSACLCTVTPRAEFNPGFHLLQHPGPCTEMRPVWVDYILGVFPKLVLFLPPGHATELVFWVSVCPIGLATARQSFITLAKGGALDIPIEDTITTPQSVPSSSLLCIRQQRR